MGFSSALTPSCTTEGETPPWPHQAPGFAESLGQGAAAVGSSWWLLGDWGIKPPSASDEGERQPFLRGRERTWGKSSCGDPAPVEALWGAEPEPELGPAVAAPETSGFSHPMRGTQGSAQGWCPTCAMLRPQHSPWHPTLGSLKSLNLFCISLFSSHCGNHCLTAENTRSDPLSQRIESETRLPLTKRGVRHACTCGSLPVGLAGLAGRISGAEGWC